VVFQCTIIEVRDSLHQTHDPHPAANPPSPFPGGDQLRNSSINITTLHLDLVTPYAPSRPRFQDACILLRRFNFVGNKLFGCRICSTNRRTY
jgi:hypothetical protein